METAVTFETFNVNDEMNSDRSSSDLNAEFLHSVLVLDVLLRMKRSTSDMNKELLDLCRNTYTSSRLTLDEVDLFARSYMPDLALWWYTRDTFLYRVTNKAFRVNNTHLLYLLHLFIRDLHNQLQQHQCKTVLDVYRFQLLTVEELNHLQKSIGNYISMNSFVSTTLNREFALFCLGSADLGTTNLKRALFEIHADPDIDGIKPFANIAAFSEFPNEDEVLFMARSIFRLAAISFDNQNQIYVFQMILCGDHENHLHAIFEQNKKNYGGGRQQQTNLMTLGNVLQRMGDLDKAEMFYRRQLDEFNDEGTSTSDVSTCFFNMGEVSREKCKYDESLTWYRKSLDLDLKSLPSDHPNIGNTHNSIGIVQEKMGDYENALDSYSTAVKINLNTYGWDNTRVALCLNNLGNVYQIIGNYSTALDCHNIAFMIREKNLPSDHHRLAASHNNIGTVYHRMENFDLALEHYKIASRINQKSLPKNHPDIMLVQRNICLLHEAQGNLDKALLHFEEELRRRQYSLGPNHPSISEIEEDLCRVRDKTQ